MKINSGQLALHALKPFAVCLGLGIALCGLVRVVGVWYFGSIPNAIASARGNPLIVASNAAELRAGSEQPIYLNISIKNAGHSDVTCIGSDACCGCRMMTNLPQPIPAEGSIDLRVELPPIPVGEIYSRELQVYTDSPGAPVLLVPIVVQ